MSEERKRDVWSEIQNLREACEILTSMPAPVRPDSADGEGDERVIRQQVTASVLLLQAALNLLTAHVFALYGDPREDTKGDI